MSASTWVASEWWTRPRYASSVTGWRARHWRCQTYDQVNRNLGDQGRQIQQGTIVDATIIEAPSSTRNRKQSRDPEMHHTRKGNPWYFGMKTHLGVDSEAKLIHSVVTTPANRHDSQVIGELLHGNETQVWGDSAYTGQGGK